MSRIRILTSILTVTAMVIAAHSFAEAKQAKKPAAPKPPLLAQACAGCHGQLGAGQGGTPVLAAYDKAAFVRVWGEFRDNQRPAASIMPRIARGYSDAEVTTLAEYFSSVPR